MKVLATILLFVSTLAQAQIKLTPASNGDFYKVPVHYEPGQTYYFEGVVRSAYFTGVRGTIDKPVIITMTSGYFTGNGAYTIVFDSTCKYFRFHSIKVIGNNTCPAFAFVGECDNYEGYNNELSGVTGGFLHNSITESSKQNIFLHDNYIHDCENPRDNGRFEGFYYGNTSKKDPGGFYNLQIENNRIENVSGDGIQVAQATNVSIKANSIKRWGQAQLLYQRTGILIGNDVSGSVVEGNSFSEGGGTAYQNFGGGYHTFRNNSFSNIDLSSLSNEDIVYIAGRSKAFSIDFSGNIFSNVTPNRKIIFNATPDSLTAGSVFCSNTGVTQSQTLLNKKDTWGCIILPVEEDEPKPPYKPKPGKGKYKVYNLAAAYLGNDKKNLNRGWYILKYEDGTTEFLRVEK